MRADRRDCMAKPANVTIVGSVGKTPALLKRVYCFDYRQSGVIASAISYRKGGKLTILRGAVRHSTL